MDMKLFRNVSTILAVSSTTTATTNLVGFRYMDKTPVSVGERDYALDYLTMSSLV